MNRRQQYDRSSKTDKSSTNQFDNSLDAQVSVACVASVTVALFAKKPIFVVLDAREMGREQKQGGGGEGRGGEGNACPQTPRFCKTRSPTNAEL